MNGNALINVVAVVGPTAVGKTKCAIALANELNGEIISCDSMQIYKGMDIGTAKPSKEELSMAKHHMIDICESTDTFSCADFIEKAQCVIEEVATRGKLPILCGGTGLYVDTLLSGTKISPVGANEELRAELDKIDSEKLYMELKSVDPLFAEKTHMNNRKRVIRALEIYRLTGKTKTEWDTLSHSESKYNSIYVGLDCENRDLLYKRIDKRVDMMFNQGLLDEAKSLRNKLSSTAIQAIGYKELDLFFQGKCSLENVIEKIKQSSRNYAKRQLTWFKRNQDISWYHTDNGLDICSVVNDVKNKLV